MIRTAWRTLYGTLPHVLGIVLGGFLLRLLFLGKESLWLDELASADFTSETFSRALSAEPTNPPLYYTLLFFSRQIIGASEAALRLPSVLFGTMSIVAVYQLGKAFGRERAGVLAASWMAISSFAIAYSQEARCFALLTLLILLSSSKLIAILGPERTWKSWLGYIFVTVLALYTHFYAVFYVLGQNLVALWAICRRRLKLSSWIACQLAVVCLFLPWLLQLLTTAQGHVQHRRYLWLKLPQALFSLLFGDSVIPFDESAVNNISGTLRENFPQLIVCVLSAILLTICFLSVARKISDFLVPLLIVALTPLLISFLLSFRIMMFDERYLAPSSPLLFLVAAAAIETSLQSPSFRLRRTAAFTVIGIGCMAAFGLQNYYLNPRYGKEQWREAMQLIKDKRQAGDLLIFEPNYTVVAWQYYGHNELTNVLLVTLPPEGDNTEFIDQHRREIAAAPRLWLVRSHHRSDTLREFLAHQFPRNELFPFPRDKGIEVHLFSSQ